jgi:hypothetical protein
MPNLRKTILRSLFALSVIGGITLASIVEFSNIAPASAQFSRIWRREARTAMARRFRFWRRRPPITLGGRGAVCAITPGLLDKDFTVLSDRPLFAWQGQASKLNVRDFKTRTIIWSADVDVNTQQLAYSGSQPLEPGKVYQWQVLGNNPTSQDRAQWSTMTVMASPERDTMMTKLKELAQTAQQSKQSPEELADEQAMYLLDQNLWSDALQVVFAVKNPSTEFVEQRKLFAENMCAASAQTSYAR